MIVASCSCIFSPILPISSFICSSMLPLPPGYGRARILLMSSVFASRTAFAILFTRSAKSSFLATKSVSHESFTNETRFLSEEVAVPILPSEVSLSAFFAAFAMPFCLRRSIAFSRSPFVSVRAFLHSIIPAPVRSLSAFISSEVFSIWAIPPRHIGNI